MCLQFFEGTTSKPKGVVWTHNMLQTQIAALHTAWQYSCHDVVLHTLPLHHIHGQLNSMLASLAAGARYLSINRKFILNFQVFLTGDDIDGGDRQHQCSYSCCYMFSFI